jgi:hypothetical protein
MQHLPKKLPPTTCPELERFKRACEQCKLHLCGAGCSPIHCGCETETLCFVMSALHSLVHLSSTA